MECTKYYTLENIKKLITEIFLIWEHSEKLYLTHPNCIDNVFYANPFSTTIQYITFFLFQINPNIYSSYYASLIEIKSIIQNETIKSFLESQISNCEHILKRSETNPYKSQKTSA